MENKKKYFNKTSYIKISSVPKEDIEALNAIATENKEDLSKILRNALRQFLANQPESMKRKPIRFQGE